MLEPFLAPDAEISLEANPADITREKLRAWKSLGFNRISLGVQTFDEGGLQFLKRDHSALQARQAMELAVREISHVNIDFIYSWPQQTQEKWVSDLRSAVEAGVAHLSLYNLTYAPRTPIGRAHARGRIQEPEDTEQALFYQQACELLAKHGYEHDEVSNWALPGFTCQHNWLYWQGAYYLGVGAGAHGFLPEDNNPIGRRYAYESRERRFTSQRKLPAQPLALSPEQAREFGITFEERDDEAWLMEYIGCGLRCRKGVDLKLIAETVNMVLQPTPFVQSALQAGQLKLEHQKLYLANSEWFRETAWSLAVLECFQRQ